ncbi:MAG: M18 family aminopeptidase [Lachnospiraceae bacterium]|nr:M18 family aminopeptidase [Lachnospiraceae bacterium]
MAIYYNETEKLLRCLKSGVSAYHTVKQAAGQLEESGFIRLEAGESWTLEKGKGYYTEVFGSSLFAFHVPVSYEAGMPVRAAAAHTDWPGPRIKPCPELTEGRYEKLNIEVYGGPIFYSWLDRPLSIAGAVCLKGEDPMHPETRLMDFRRPMAVIPSLAIHYNREVNTKLELNAQKDLLPVLDVLPPEWKQDGYFHRLLAEELQVEPDSVLSWDLGFYNLDEPVLYGEHTEMLSSPRLDNLTSVQGCVSALIRASQADTFSAIMLFDNEEVGSNTKQGADSVLLARLLEKTVISLRGSHGDFADSTMNGILLSCDVSHALHPNRPDKNDLTNRVFPGDGVTFKLNSSQSYATDVRAVALAEGVCRKAGIPHKSFCNRADIRGGSTLGSMLSAQLCIRTLDLGVPILSMHSSRELMATADQKALTDFIAGMMMEQ